MTWVKVADAPPVSVRAHKITYNREPHVQLTVGNQTAFLSEEDAKSLGVYLINETSNSPVKEERPPPVNEDNTTPEGAVRN